MHEIKLDVRIYGDALVIAEPPFLLVMYRDEMRIGRKPRWELLLPPCLYLVRYNARFHETAIEPIEWSMAEALAPEPFHILGRRISEMREKLYREAQETAQNHPQAEG
jgi:hypothetical protein